MYSIIFLLIGLISFHFPLYAYQSKKSSTNKQLGRIAQFNNVQNPNEYERKAINKVEKLYSYYIPHSMLLLVQPELVM